MANASFKSIWFIAGLSLAAGTAVLLDGVVLQKRDPFDESRQLDTPLYALASIGDISENDVRHAQIAWDFISSQTQPETGLVNSVQWFPSTTLWDQASYLIALVSAAKLGIISSQEFDERADKALSSLARLQLIEGDLPNKVYNTKSLTMTDYDDTPTPNGIGWSALDIARILLSLRILEKYSPQHGVQVRDAVATWNLDSITHKGEFVGGNQIDGHMKILQEGRIGYEQYAARAAAMWGLDVSSAMSVKRILEWRYQGNLAVPIDQRKVSRYQTINPTSSEPYILMGLEMGFDDYSHILAGQILAAQEMRSHKTGMTTIVSEDHLDAEPYFAYASVFSNMTDWAVVDITGVQYPAMRTQSTKASFAWDALFDTEFTNNAVEKVETLGITGQGWYAGIYETTGEENRALSLNTNAVILASIHYKAFGPLWQNRID